MAENDLQGAFDLLELKTLSRLDSMHGYGVVMQTHPVSGGQIIVEEGSYRAFDRMEQSGWISASWAVTEYGRKAKARRREGQEQLAQREKNWEQVADGVQAIPSFA